MIYLIIVKFNVCYLFVKRVLIEYVSSFQLWIYFNGWLLNERLQIRFWIILYNFRKLNRKLFIIYKILICKILQTWTLLNFFNYKLFTFLINLKLTRLSGTCRQGNNSNFSSSFKTFKCIWFMFLANHGDRFWAFDLIVKLFI